MSDGMFSAHAALNAGAIPASAEELSQRYIKLFQQYSRLKAQHAVLKKAVIKEQTSNVTLQGYVKDKEKELRKLQEQMDLLAFHNERLTKRIQAVQDSEQKGSHFSLLGGSVKKELEKSSQALEAANLDLERKIQENEDLHKELKDRQFEFTENINMLLKQIQDLEKKNQELQDENAAIQSETNTFNTTTTHQDQDKLLEEIDTLKNKLQETTDLFNKKETEMRENDIKLITEIQSLRSILLAKVGSIDTSLYDIIPPSASALKELEDKTKEYFSSREKGELSGDLPLEIAEKLALSNESYAAELNKLLAQLEELNKLNIEKDEKLAVNENELKEKDEKILNLVSTIDKNAASIEKLQELNHSFEQENQKLRQELEHKTEQESQKQREELENKTEQEKRRELEDSQIKQENQKLRQELEDKISNLGHTLKELEDTKNELTVTKESLDKAIQENQKLSVSQEGSNQEEEEEEVFVYPTSNGLDTANNSNGANSAEAQDGNEEDEDEVFVYSGVDAVSDPKEEVPQVPATPSKQDIEAREAKLKAYYEQKLNALTEKLQLTDSKAYRFASMYKNLKEKLVKEEQVKESLMQENQKLNKEVKNVQDLLSTTESNYQKQIDAMTEFITSLQQNAEDRQYNRRSNNNYK